MAAAARGGKSPWRKLLLAAGLLLASTSALAAPPGFEPGIAYYFDSFDPQQKPWQPGPPLNLEEVFKNYLYYEILFDKAGNGLTVKRYIRNNRERTDRFVLKPDGSLEAGY